MRRKLIIVFLLCLGTQFLYADNAKRQTIIKGIIEHELGSGAIYDVEESIFKDSIRTIENDSVNIRQALKAFDVLHKDFIDNAARFVALFPAGTNNYTPSVLSDKQLPVYESLSQKMRESLKEYKLLVNNVQNYEPYQQRRCDEVYVVKNGRGNIERYRGVYFFDSEDNLERYFWLSSFDKKSVMGMIHLAREHNFEFISEMLTKANINLGKKMLTYLVADKDNSYPHEMVVKLQTERKLQAKKQTIKVSQHYRASQPQKNTQTTWSQNVSRRPSNVNGSTPKNYVYNEHNTYVVVKSVCGATYNKEAMSRFTKYATTNNTNAIDYMLASGELVVLRQGQQVIMVDPGYILSRVMLRDGRVVITDTENLKKK